MFRKSGEEARFQLQAPRKACTPRAAELMLTQHKNVLGGTMRHPFLAAASLAWSAFFPFAASAQAPAVALTGQVSSADEAKMEGVLVSATKAGSNITVTVVTGADGRYSFPASRLGPGQYTLAVRAVGYELDSASGAGDKV